MAKLVQLITYKVPKDIDRDQVLKEMKEVKKGFAEHGVDYAAHYAIEAGPASGLLVISMSYPSAVKWAESVDSKDEKVLAFRQKLMENPDAIVSTSLLQEVDL